MSTTKKRSHTDSDQTTTLLTVPSSENNNKILSELTIDPEISLPEEVPEESSSSEDDEETPDEYDTTDSSDEEDLRYSIGNIPMKWYEDLEHAGYDLDGKQISKPVKGDELDKLVNKMSDPDFWKTIQDPLSNRKQVLTNEELGLLAAFSQGRTAKTATSLDPHAPAIDFFTQDKMQTALTGANESKKSFIPSLLDRKKVGHLVHLIKTGKFKLDREKSQPDDLSSRFYDIWGDFERDDYKTKSQLARLKMHIPAPKAKLPGHEESYRPPPEYILDDEEKSKWEEADPEDRNTSFLPQLFKTLRHIPSYSRFINDRFERCLDLYLCPRQRKMKLHVDPDSLIPKLPKPKDLQPFPMVDSLKYVGHGGRVVCVTATRTGQYLASGDDKGQLKIWEMLTGYCTSTIQFPGEDARVSQVDFYPKAELSSILLVAVGRYVYIINANIGDRVSAKKADVFFHKLGSIEENSEVKNIVSWEKEVDNLTSGRRFRIKHNADVKSIQWHSSGTYFLSTATSSSKKQVLIHRLGEKKSMCPFKTSDGLVHTASFHPTKPHLYVARQSAIKIYDLQSQTLLKTLQPSGQIISSISVHPSTGDHVLVSTFDNRTNWIDMDLSVKPYKIIPSQSSSRKATFHPGKYPLFAIAQDDGSCHIWHSTVYTDMTQNPLLVPVRVLKPFKPEVKKLSCLDCFWHPTQPWIFCSFSDGTIRLFS